MAEEQPVTDVSEMETIEDKTEQPAAEAHDCDPPNRARRTWFIFVSCGLAYVSIMLLAFFGNGKIAELAADGFVSYLMVTGVAYVAAHSIDRSEIFTKMGDRFGRRYNMRDE